MLTVEPLYFQPLDIISRGRNSFHLHMPFSTDKQHFTMRVYLLQCICYTDSREDMSSRSTSAN